MCLFTLKNAEASVLRLYANPSIYVGDDPDTWFHQSYLTGPGSDFSLQIINDYNAEGANPNSISNLWLVLAIKDATKTAGLDVDLGGTSYDEGDFTSTGDHKYHDYLSQNPEGLPPHGIFGANTYYFNYLLDDITLNPQESYWLDVSITNIGEGGPQLVHFDVYGDLQKKNNVQRIFNPFSHDVTWDPPEYERRTHTPIPEPTTLSLLGMGLLGMAGLRKKRN